MKKIDYKKSIVAALSLSFIGLSGSVQSASDSGYIGSVDYVAFNFAPRGSLSCDGQLLSISQYTTLYSLLGTTYGGDGRTSFALPDMRGRVPIHTGTGPGLSTYHMGPGGGVERATLTVNNMPVHSHASTATSTSVLKGVTAAGDSLPPAGKSIARSPVGDKNFSASAPSADMHTGSVTTTTTIVPKTAGGGQAFSIMQPYTVLRCIVATEGTYPPRS